MSSIVTKLLEINEPRIKTVLMGRSNQSDPYKTHCSALRISMNSSVLADALLVLIVAALFGRAGNGSRGSSSSKSLEELELALPTSERSPLCLFFSSCLHLPGSHRIIYYRQRCPSCLAQGHQQPLLYIREYLQRMMKAQELTRRKRTRKDRLSK